MANNTQLNTGSGGDIIVDLDLSNFVSYPTTGKLPLSAIYVGASTGSAPTPLSNANPLPVSLQNAIPAGSAVIGAVTQSGSWTVTVSGTSAFNLSQVGGSAVALGQTTMAASVPVALASNQSALAVSQSGSWTVSGTGTFTVSGTITANQGGTWTVATNADCAVGNGAAPSKALLAAGVYNSSLPTLTTGQTAGIQVDSSGRIIVGSVAGTVTVSGTVTTTPPVNASTNVAQFGGTNVSTGTGPGGAGIPRVTVSNDSNILATQSGSWTVTANIGTTNGLALDTSVNGLLVAQASTTSGQSGPLIQGAVTTNAPSYTTAKTSPLSLDTSGLLRASLKDTPSNTNNLNVNLAASAATVTVSGTLTANQGGSNWTVNQTQWNGTTVDTNSGTKSAGTVRVVLATDQPTMTNAQPVSQNGTWTVGLNAGTAVVGHVILDPSSAAGGLSTDFTSALSTTVRAVKASAGRLYNVTVQNPNSSDAWVQLFDLATGGVTLGTTTPKKSIPVPALGSTALDWVNGITFATAISAAAATAATGSTAPTTGLVWNADYV